MLPSKMAMAAPNWVWGPPVWGEAGTRWRGAQQPEVEPWRLRALRWGGTRNGRGWSKCVP